MKGPPQGKGKGKKKSRPPASFVTVPSQESHQRVTTGSDSSHVSPIRPPQDPRERKIAAGFLPLRPFGQLKPRCSAPNYLLDRYQLPCVKLSLSAIPASSSI